MAGSIDDGGLARALAAEEEGLLTCVHCGLCLPACPTYDHLGDENDSPRGRLHLMRAVVEGRLGAGSDAFQLHIDRCLGCRACEPVCPSGVPYGSLLELARAEGAAARAPSRLQRALLRSFASDRGAAALMSLSRLLRATGIPAVGARLLPEVGPAERARLALGMLAATRRWRELRKAGRGASARRAPSPGAQPASVSGGGEPDGEVLYEEAPAGRAPEVALLTGCVQGGLFGHVNDATARTLRANGYRVRSAPEQGCCGALHAHGGDLETARAMARRNIAAFEASGVDRIVVNAAGCGAIMKEYGHLLEGDPEWAGRGARLAAKVRDVSEALVERGPRRGAAVELAVAYDAPCHLVHAQRVDDAPRQVLGAVPGVELAELEGAETCCGGAGVYGLLHPDLGGRIADRKVGAVRESGADVVVTGNPGCIMQIGAGLRMAGVDVPVAHPVEILDESYRRAGMYDGEQG